MQTQIGVSRSEELMDESSIESQYSKLRVLARSIVGDSGSLDDLVQQTWLHPLFNPVRRSLAWFRTVMWRLRNRERQRTNQRTCREKQAASREELPSAEEIASQHEILTKIEELYGVDIKISQKALLNEHRTIGIPMKDLDIVIPILEKTLDVHITREKNKLFIK